MMGCSRCGNCCNTVGRTFWKAMFLDQEIIPQLPVEILTKLKDGDHEDSDLPCEMLFENEDGLATCYLQAYTGFKPSVCRNHVGDERCVLTEKI